MEKWAGGNVPPCPPARTFLLGSGESDREALPSVAANRSMEPARLSKTVRGELDWLAMKALEKDRSRRYETASSNAFSKDGPVPRA